MLILTLCDRNGLGPCDPVFSGAKRSEHAADPNGHVCGLCVRTKVLDILSAPTRYTYPIDV